MSRAPVRIAVVGAGLIGRQHAHRVRAEPEADLAAIVDPAPEAAAFGRELGAPWFESLEAMLDGARPDGVIVATPNRLHVANGMACLAAGLPMLLEKPVSDDLASGWALVQAAERAGVPILVGHHRRHSPIMAAARALLAEGRLGRVTSVAALAWFLKPDDYFEAAWRRGLGAGPVLINLIHMIDDLLSLTGDVVLVQAAASGAARSFAVEDSAAVILRFASGALGNVSVSDAAAAPWSWELGSGENRAYPRTGEPCYFLAGTEGALALPRLELWRHRGDRGWWSPIEATRMVAPDQDPLVLQLRQFLAVIRGEAAPLVTGRSAMRTLEVTLAVKDAAASGRAVVPGTPADGEQARSA